MRLTFHTRSASETRALGQHLGTLLRPGDIVALTGELGAGKTVFAQGLAAGLGVSPEVPIQSPTYAIVHTYQGRMPFVHADCYRLTGADDLTSAGLLDLTGGGAAACVEWAGMFPTAFPGALWIGIAESSPTGRTITIAAEDAAGWSGVLHTLAGDPTALPLPMPAPSVTPGSSPRPAEKPGS